MDFGLKDKIVLITGRAGNRGGIGETIVNALAPEGTIPVIQGGNDRGHKYVIACYEAEINATYQLNLTSADSIKNAVTLAIKKHDKIDVAINNGGTHNGIWSKILMIVECFTPAYDRWLKLLPNLEEKLNAVAVKIPWGRGMTTNTEIADAVLFLISERLRHAMGQCVYAGGWLVHPDRALLTEN